MALVLSPLLTHVQGRWAQVKAIVIAKSLNFQYYDDGNMYTIYAYDFPEVYVCQLWKSSIPESLEAYYSQAQNNADKSDFENNYKSLGNGPISADVDQATKRLKVLSQVSVGPTVSQVNQNALNLALAQAVSPTFDSKGCYIVAVMAQRAADGLLAATGVLDASNEGVVWAPVTAGFTINAGAVIAQNLANTGFRYFRVRVTAAVLVGTPGVFDISWNGKGG